MKSFIKAVALAAVIAAPVASFAQSNQPVTRAEVRAELAQVSQAGYRAGGHDPYYPRDIQAAEARVTVAQGGGAPATTADVGGTVGGAMQSGGAAAATGGKSIYFGE